MKKTHLCLLVLASAASLVGCASVKNEDFYRANLHTALQPAVFKPEVEVIKQELVKGFAEKEKIWIFTTKAPNKFATNPEVSVGFGLLADSLESAAVYDACEKSGATILLAPRFTEEIETSGFLGLVKNVRMTVEGIPARVIGAKEVKPTKPVAVCCGGVVGNAKAAK